MTISPPQDPAVLDALMKQKARERAFVFCWQETNGEFRSVTNLKEPSLVSEFLRGCLVGEMPILELLGEASRACFDSGLVETSRRLDEEISKLSANRKGFVYRGESGGDR